MKFQSNAKVLVIDKETRTSEAGKTSYYLAIAQKAEAGTMSCSEEVFNKVVPMTPYTVIAVYDDRYSYTKIVGVIDDISASAGKK